jgi:hypothetical protein
VFIRYGSRRLGQWSGELYFGLRTIAFNIGGDDNVGWEEMETERKRNHRLLAATRGLVGCSPGRTYMIKNWLESILFFIGWR